MASAALAPLALATVALPADGAPRGEPVVVALGDSLTAGYGLPYPPTQSWPAQAQLLAGRAFRFVNDGVNGNRLSTAAGPSYGTPPMEVRLGKILRQHPWAVVLLGGTNDNGVVPVAVDERAIATMAEEAARARTHFFVVTIPPVSAHPFIADLRPAFIEALNGWILSRFHTEAIDYWRFLSGPNGLLLGRYDSGDGVHPDAAADHWLALHVLARLEQARRP